MSEKYQRPDWDQYYLGIARAVSARSTCLRRRYGAVIVKDHVIISTGYNGAPRGEINCSDTGLCERERLNIPPGEQYEKCVACHAEENAIINGTPERMKGATIYIAGTEAKDGSEANAHPCLLCKRKIKNAQIEEVVFKDKKGEILKRKAKDL